MERPALFVGDADGEETLNEEQVIALYSSDPLRVAWAAESRIRSMVY